MILLNIAGLARPARMAENSSRVASTDLSILPSASLRMSLITGPSLRWSRRLLVGRACRDPQGSVGGDERTDLLTLHDAQDVAPLLHAEHDQRQLVLHAEREGRGVGDPEVGLQRLLEGQRVVLRDGGVDLGVAAVDAVHPLLA